MLSLPENALELSLEWVLHRMVCKSLSSLWAGFLCWCQLCFWYEHSKSHHLPVEPALPSLQTPSSSISLSHTLCYTSLWSLAELTGVLSVWWSPELHTLPITFRDNSKLYTAPFPLLQLSQIVGRECYFTLLLPGGIYLVWYWHWKG